MFVQQKNNIPQINKKKKIQKPCQANVTFYMKILIAKITFLLVNI